MLTPTEELRDTAVQHALAIHGVAGGDTDLILGAAAKIERYLKDGTTTPDGSVDVTLRITGTDPGVTASDIHKALSSLNAKAGRRG